MSENLPAPKKLPVFKELRRRVTGRDTVSIVMVLAVGLWGAWHEMQVVVLLAGAAGLAVLHGGGTNRVFHSALGFGNRLTSAKWKDVEVAAPERRSQSAPSTPVDGHLRVLVGDLDPHAFGMMHRVRREGSIEITAANHNRAVFLQDRGLLTAEERESLSADEWKSLRLWARRPTWAGGTPRSTFWVSLSGLGSEVLTELDTASAGVVDEGRI